MMRTASTIQAIVFTFHYVSILIALYQLTPKCGTDFTFHYVAILIGVYMDDDGQIALFTSHYVSIFIPR